MEPFQVVITVVPTPTGGTINIAANRPADQMTMARILSGALKGVLDQSPAPVPQPVIEVAAPNRVASILNGRG